MQVKINDVEMDIDAGSTVEDAIKLSNAPYIKGSTKTFWSFTSTSPDIQTSYNFLGKKSDLKSGIPKKFSNDFTFFYDSYSITKFFCHVKNMS